MALVKMGFYVGHGTDVVVGCCFHQDCNTMRTIAFVEDLFIVLHFLSLGAFDSGFHAVFWHINALGVLETTAQGRVCTWVGASCLDGDGDFLTDTGELFGHPVPTGKHGVFSYFKYATHSNYCIWGANLHKKSRSQKVERPRNKNDLFLSAIQLAA